MAKLLAHLVVDTCVLQKANAKLSPASPPKEGRLFKIRVNLLKRLSAGEAKALYSKRLLAEYGRQIQEPRNEFVAAFLVLLTTGAAELNWQALSGAERENLRRCRYPPEDQHLLRTGKGKRSTIVTEEGRLLKVDNCTHRFFGVHISEPSTVVFPSAREH